MSQGRVETQERDRTWLKEGLILLAFVLLIAAGIVTVVIPELAEEPENEGAAGSARDRQTQTASEPEEQ